MPRGPDRIALLIAGCVRHHGVMVKPNITSAQATTTTPKPPAVEVKPATAEAAKPAGVAADIVAPPTGEPTTATKGDPAEKRHPYTVQLSPSVWRRAKLLASLQGSTISRMVEADLVKRIATELKALIEGLDKTGE